MIIEKKEKITTDLLLFLCGISCATLFFYGNNKVGNVFLLLQSACLALLFFVNRQELLENQICVFLYNVFCILLTLTFYSGYGIALICINLFSALILCNTISLQKVVYQYLHSLMAFLLLVFLISIKMTPNYNFMIYHTFFGDEINPNMVGVILVAFAMHSLCFLDGLKNEVHFSLLLLAKIIIVAVVGYYVYLTDCRSALLVYVLLLGALIVKRKPFGENFFKIVVAIVLLGSLLFPMIYIALYNWLDNFELFGKSFFSGRERVWKESLRLIQNNLIFGSGTELPIVMPSGETTQSAHHALFSIWKAVGIVPTISFVYFCIERNKKGKSKAQRTAQIAFVCCLFFCFFESLFTEKYLYLLFVPFLLSDIKQEETNIPLFKELDIEGVI